MIRTFFSFLFALLAFCLLSLRLKWSFFPALAITALLYVALYLLFKPVSKIGRIETDLLKNGQEAKELLELGKKDLREIMRLSQKIAEVDYRVQVEKTSQTAASLLDYLEKNPAKIFKARSFLTYQLNLALDSIKDYLDVKVVHIDLQALSAFHQQSMNIMKIMQETFEKQFEALVQDKLINMEIQNEVLEAKIKAEKGVGSHE